MIDFTKEGKIGDKVRDYRMGSGVITEIIPNDTYPIKVNFKNNFGTYTADGRELRDDKQLALTFANGNFIVDQGTPPKREEERLYCGLTEDQWRRVIDERFRVEVGDCTESVWINKPVSVLRYLTDVVPDDCYPYKTRIDQWTRARIPKEVGIRKPHFGGACPTTHEGEITFKLRNGDWVNMLIAKGVDVWHWRKGDESSTDIMEYIELP